MNVERKNHAKTSILVPALDCETGVCSVKVNPKFLRITAVPNSMKRNGLDVKRFNLNIAPIEFMTNSIANKHLNTNGAVCLPIVLLDNEIITTER